MSDIFLSYASEDRPKARLLAARLEQEGWSVWWDRKIPVGQSFATVLEEALNTTQCVVVLWSQASRVSDWVQNEASEGKRRNILVPALLENTTPPFEFKRIQAANLVGWHNQAMGNELDQLLEAIKRVLARAPSAGSAKDGGAWETTSEEEQEHTPNPDIWGGDQDKPAWQRWGGVIMLVVFIGLSMMGVFKALYPQTSVTEALSTIAIASVVAGAGLNYCWRHWRRASMKK